MVYTGIGTVLVILIAAITFTAAQSPPPAIAEIAPSAVQQIKDAPSEQSSDLGEGEGGSGGDGGSTTTTLAPGAATTLPPGAATTVPESIIERPRVRRCIGSPPRQIEDPQSPPCVPYFEGDNGGATSRGVTKTSITVKVPDMAAATKPLEAFLNKRFEFYGRQLKLETIVTGGTCDFVKAGAAGVAESKSFAALSVLKQENCFMEELARLKVVGISDDPVLTTAELQKLHPYIWYYPQTFDEILTGLGQWACARFAGANARFAEGPNIKTGQPMSLSKRKFGLIVQPYATGHPLDTSPLDRALSACGEPAPPKFVYPDNDLIGQNASRNAAIKMQSEGVTSVLCMCGSFSNLLLPGAASSQGYNPEWLVTSYNHNDSNINMKTFWPDAGQRANVMGLSVRSRQWTFADTPLMWAIKEGDPSFDEERDQAVIYEGQWKKFYRMLLVLASGIQLAGPNLTPETFAQGLQKAQFPNPVTGLEAGKVGFNGGSHAMTKDSVETFWSESAPGPYRDGPGTICYVDGGARRVAGRYPKGDGPFFALACDGGFQRAPNPTG